MANISTFLQTQQQRSSNFFHCLALELYIYRLACCIVCFCCLFVCLFVYLFVCLFITVVTMSLLLLCHLCLFLCTCTYLCSYGLAFFTIILLQFNIFLEINISVFNLVRFVYFALCFSHLRVHTCKIVHLFILS